MVCRAEVEKTGLLKNAVMCHVLLRVVTVRDFLKTFLFVSGCTPDAPQSLALLSSSATLIFLHSSFVM